MGSGIAIKNAIKKYGIVNFNKMIINYYSIREEALKEEINIVDKDFVSFNWTYNLTVGGRGSFKHINDDPELKNKMRELLSKTHKGKKVSEETKSKIRKARTGTKHTEETKNKVGAASKGRNVLHKNYGARPVQHIPTGIFFSCLKEASEVMELKYAQIHKRIQKNYKLNEFRYVQ